MASLDKEEHITEAYTELLAHMITENGDKAKYGSLVNGPSSQNVDK